MAECCTVDVLLLFRRGTRLPGEGLDTNKPISPRHFATVHGFGSKLPSFASFIDSSQCYWCGVQTHSSRAV